MTKRERQSLADQLRRAIEGSGITLYRLSQDSGVDRSQLSRFMRGERDMSLVVSDKICEVLGLKFCGTGEGVALAHGGASPFVFQPATPSTPPADELQEQATARKRGKATSGEKPKRGRGRPRKEK